MSLPLKRRVLRVVLLVLVLAAVREWNIRRHEADLGSWPRADEAAVPS